MSKRLINTETEVVTTATSPDLVGKSPTRLSDKALQDNQPKPYKKISKSLTDKQNFLLYNKTYWEYYRGSGKTDRALVPLSAEPVAGALGYQPEGGSPFSPVRPGPLTFFMRRGSSIPQQAKTGSVPVVRVDGKGLVTLTEDLREKTRKAAAVRKHKFDGKTFQ